MGRVTRRRLLQISGTAAAGAQTGGLAGVLAGRAPAYGQRRKKPSNGRMASSQKSMSDR
jgi:hypothetical protein